MDKNQNKNIENNGTITPEDNSIAMSMPRWQWEMALEIAEDLDMDEDALLEYFADYSELAENV